ncbi:MAG: PQQ-dependent sugar dehydrogenase [Bdellovibrionota bacterium]
MSLASKLLRLTHTSNRSQLRSMVLAASVSAACSIAPAAPALAENPPKAAATIALEEVADGYKRPVQIVVAPGEDGRIYIVEQSGKVVPLKVGSPEERDPIVDLTDAVATVPEGGLLGFAFHPKYPEVSKGYAHYIGKSREVENRISEVVLADGAPGGVNEERKLIRLSQGAVVHIGGQIMFGPDNYLYIGIGDGGAHNDPKETGQNFGDQFGNILRIDVEEQTATNQPYLAPVDNPFVSGTRGNRDVWAGGLRDPRTFSFDSKTNNLWVGDTGAGLMQEVDIVKPGGNYGWSVFDGAECLRMRFECMNQKYQPPVVSYLKQDGAGVTVGYVYRGKAMPDLEGTLIYGDRVSGKIWGLKYEDEKLVSNTLLLATDKDVSAFGQKANGELLLADYKTGKIFRIVSAQPEKAPAKTPATASMK